MVVEPQELDEPPETKRSKWKNIKSELIFWTSLVANLITIFFFIYKLIKNGS